MWPLWNEYQESSSRLNDFIKNLKSNCIVTQKLLYYLASSSIEKLKKALVICLNLTKIPEAVEKNLDESHSVRASQMDHKYESLLLESNFDPELSYDSFKVISIDSSGDPSIDPGPPKNAYQQYLKELQMMLNKAKESKNEMVISLNKPPEQSHKSIPRMRSLPVDLIDALKKVPVIDLPENRASKDLPYFGPFESLSHKLYCIGQFESNKMNGYGITFDLIGHGFGFYWGQKSNGKSQGFGVALPKNGGVYIGQWKDGSKHGRGKLFYPDGREYDGDWLLNNRHGQGRMNYKDGGCYLGDWKNNQRDGYGVETSPNGSTYEGQWKDNQMHGKGIGKKRNGLRYEGEWREGKKHGKDAEMVLPSGDKYTGGFVDGKMEGDGVYVWKNGESYYGQWSNNLRHGNGTHEYTDKSTYKGSWKEGKRSGYGVMTLPGGFEQKGVWLDDELVKEMPRAFSM